MTSDRAHLQDLRTHFILSSLNHVCSGLVCRFPVDKGSSFGQCIEKAPYWTCLFSKFVYNHFFLISDKDLRRGPISVFYQVLVQAWQRSLKGVDCIAYLCPPSKVWISQPYLVMEFNLADNRQHYDPPGRRPQARANWGDEVTYSCGLLFDLRF